MNNMAVGIKTIETLQQRLPIAVLLVIFYIVVFSHLKYSALCLFQTSSTLVLSLEEQITGL